MTGAPPEADLAIRTVGLGKRFGARQVVRDVGLRVPRGSVFGFLGPNGSGKTTTIRMLLGLAAPTTGSISLLGHAMPQSALRVLPRVGALVEGPAFYPYLSGRANLLRYDAADPTTDPGTRAQRVQQALERVGLSRAAKLAVHAYSLGMKQRLGIAHTLAAERDLLVLDEPTNGLDPQGTREVRNLVGSLAGAGLTVFVSSHLLSEIEQVCTHAAIMGNGRLLAQGTLDELRGTEARRVVVHTRDTDATHGVLARLGLTPVPDGDRFATADGGGGVAHGGGAGGDGAGGAGTVRASTGPGAPPPEEIVAALVAAGVGVRGFIVERTSLEDRFVQLTGEGFDVA